MKKLMIFVIVLLFLSSAYAFEKGTINVGGDLSWSSSKSNSDDDEARTDIDIGVQGGYFIKDNLNLNLLLDFRSYSEDESDESIFGFGLGGRYFFTDKFYAGPAFIHYSHDMNDYSFTGNFLRLEAGLMHPLMENVYLNFGVDYDMGFGEYGGDQEGDNEETYFEIRAGLQFFFKKHVK